MSRNIKVLIVEDSKDDALLLVRQLNKNQFETEYEIVDNEADYTHALNTKEWDLILSDYNLPQFTGIEAFRIFKKKDFQIPFIMVSGAIGEDVAVAAMKEGIHDYVMKNNPERLVPAIERELKEATVRQEKQAVDKIIISERQKFERLVNLSPMGLVIIRNDGIIKFVNPKIIDFFGYEKEELKTLSDLAYSIFPDRPEYHWVREYFTSNFNPQKHSHELHLPPAIGKDGIEKHISLRSGIIDNDSYFLLIEDVTIQRLAMRALEENQKRLWQIIQSVDDIIIEIRINESKEFLVISVNDAFIRTTGLSKDKIINGNLELIFMEGHRIYAVIQNVIITRKADNFEDTLEINNMLFTWEIGVAPIYTENGQLMRIILSAHDITERKNSEIKLRESETKFRLIASLASDAIWEWQMDENTIWWNEGIQTLFGYSPDTIDNNYRWLLKKIHPDDRGKFNSLVDTALAEKTDNLNTDFLFECSDGTFKVVNCKMNIYFGLQDKPERVLGAMIDLTQRKKIEELRIQSLVEGADNERASIARELHDSLSQNLTLASILIQGFLEKNADLNSVEKLNEAEKIVTKVLNDTRDISHSLLPKTLDDFGLKSAVENLVEHLSTGIDFKINIYCNFEDQRFSKPVEMNLFRIIQESLNNIIKHASASQVYISLSRAENSLTLMVEDNGKGFDSEDTKIISGVGLRNIENRAIYLNGKLTVESRKGKGTLVMVDVPL